MSRHLGLVAARLHAVLAHRPGSDVFHVYAGPKSRRTGRIPRGARPVGNCRTRQLHELERAGSVLDLGGRRLCGRCEARLSAVARRASQPVSRDACLAYYRGITLGDLLVATAMAETVDETHRIGFVLGLLFGQAEVIRPVEPKQDPDGRWFVLTRYGDKRYLDGDLLDRHRISQAKFDVQDAINRRRRTLVSAARTPEEIEAARAQRELDAARDEQMRAARRKGAAMDRAVDRRFAGRYLMPHERELLDSA